MLWPFIFTAALAAVVFVALALARSAGATESKPLGPISRPRRRGMRELVDAAGTYFENRGYGVLADLGDEKNGELFVEHISPLIGQRIFVKVIPSGPTGLVDSGEVRRALDWLQGEQVSKAVLVTDGQFSQEARAMAIGERIELLEGDRLAHVMPRLPAEPPAAQP